MSHEKNKVREYVKLVGDGNIMQIQQYIANIQQKQAKTSTFIEKRLYFNLTNQNRYAMAI